MKKMPVLRLLLVGLSLALILFTAGCGKKQPAPADDPTQPSPVAGPEPTDAGTDPTEATDPAQADTQPQAEMGVTNREEFSDGSGTEETKPQQPDTGAAPAPENTDPQPLPPADLTDPASITYAQFLAMTDEEEEAFVESFPTLRDFINWRNAALEKEPDRDKELLDGNEIDLGKQAP